MRLVILFTCGNKRKLEIFNLTRKGELVNSPFGYQKLIYEVVKKRSIRMRINEILMTIKSEGFKYVYVHITFSF